MSLNLVCKKEELTSAISTVQKAVPSKTTYPILEGILLKAKGDCLVLTANNLEMGIECRIKADVKEEGEIVIESRIFGEIIRRMPDAEISIEEKNDNVKITCKNSKFEIKGTRAENFPIIPEIEKEKTLKVCQAVIKDMIRQTIFAVGEDENRPILTGVNIEAKNGVLTFVSIDGFRLALRKYHIEDKNVDINVIVPGKILNEIGKILAPVEDEVSIYISKNQIMFDTGNTKILSRLLEGEYFNYENVIPEEYESKLLRISKKELLNSIERASILITSDGARFPITITLNVDKVVITTNTNLGSATEEIYTEVTGNNIYIKFNPRYFIEALRVIEEEFIDVLFSSDMGPCIIKSVDKDTFIYLLLPLKK